MPFPSYPEKFVEAAVEAAKAYGGNIISAELTAKLIQSTTENLILKNPNSMQMLAISTSILKKDLNEILRELYKLAKQEARENGQTFTMREEDLEKQFSDPNIYPFLCAVLGVSLGLNLSKKNPVDRS